ncbi:MAG TPA: amidohydrolase [Halanaerobiales bacterium]|nr:amidohydrolase [Halanaerobiales bacterium]
MILIKDAQILTMADNDYKQGSILIKDGKIAKISENIEIKDEYEVIDAKDQIVMPGVIDAHTHLGIGEEGVGWEGQDYNEMTDPFTPQLRAIDAVNPDDYGIKEALEHGVTTIMTGPGSANVVGGESMVIKTTGKTIDEMVLKNPAGIKAAFGENPKRVYNEQKKLPTTRMGIAAVMRENLMKAEDYLAKKEKAQKDDEPFDRDIKMESLIRIIKKELPLKVHAHRADDIMTAIRIAKEFDIDITLEHCTEGHKVADEIAEANIPAIVGPSMTGRVKVELSELSFKTAGVLAKAGVKIALMSDHPVIPTKNATIYAALAIKGGLEEKEALKAITINPAEILGVDDRVGSIEEGKDADLIIFKGHPLDISSDIQRVIVNGEVVKREEDEK